MNSRSTHSEMTVRGLNPCERLLVISLPFIGCMNGFHDCHESLAGNKRWHRIIRKHANDLPSSQRRESIADVSWYDSEARS